ncbi:hypothetical protein M3I53_25940 [Paraburkholderia sp. CNPSo 3272]|uniref:hypothetical protein n=1 Tax=Paraburkholderia sp. CNPSo 3272 TaxID=2940931 RepID=UPI0020B65A86|nr:hypothetical protein [Paraburkholderia sp. CNPSo 3272]MCP3726530.1 hypothetical protein [Paraburkholderia sp. CNPSo 3272]
MRDGKLVEYMSVCTPPYRDDVALAVNWASSQRLYGRSHCLTQAPSAVSQIPCGCGRVPDQRRVVLGRPVELRDAEMSFADRTKLLACSGADFVDHRLDTRDVRPVC